MLTPTRIYVKALLELFKTVPVKALCHITGGGLLENLPRVLPDNACASINTASWEWPEVFSWLQREGGVETTEMYRTFNCGVGMVVCVDAEHINETLKILSACGEDAWVLGSIVPAQDGDELVLLMNFQI